MSYYVLPLCVETSKTECAPSNVHLSLDFTGKKGARPHGRHAERDRRIRVPRCPDTSLQGNSRHAEAEQETFQSVEAHICGVNVGFGAIHVAHLLRLRPRKFER